MGIDREIESQITDQDITTGAAYGSYQNTSGATEYVSAELRLSKLTATAATITSGIQKFASNGTTLIGNYISSSPKFLAANAVFSSDPNRIRLEDDEIVKFWVESSNASDNNGGGAATGPDIDIAWTNDNIMSETSFANLELGWDGTTGVMGDTFPSRQDQVSALSIGAAGLSVNASSVNVTTGSETNSYTDTFSAGVIHIVEDAGGTTLFEYVFDLSEFSGTATNFLWTGYIQSQNDTVDVQYYDEVAAGWKTLQTLSGFNGTTLIEHDFDVPVNGTGTGANFGRTRLRFSSSTTTAIGTDRVRCIFSQAMAGITNGSTITLSASQINKNFSGENWNLALASQVISGSYFHGANVTGISSATTGVTFDNCILGAGTYPPGKYRDGGIGDADGLFTAASAGEYVFDGSYSVVAGTGTPDFTFVGLGVGGTSINNRGWLGGVAYTLDSNCTLSHEVLAGGGTTVTTGGANVEIRGTCREITIISSAGGTTNIIAITGTVAVSGAGGTVNVWGVSTGVTDAGGGTTTNDFTTSQANITGGAYALNTTGTGAIDVGLWLGTAVATPNTAGIPSVDVVELAGGEYKIADTTGNWVDDTKWSDGVAPVAGDNIIIRDGVTVTVSATLDLGQFGTLELQGDAKLNIAGGQTVATVPRGWVINQNGGTITDNYGTVTDSYGTITTNNGTVTDNSAGTIADNYGTVTANNGTVTANYGTVTDNAGTIADNYGGGTVIYNVGTITTNNTLGVVLHNYGTIGTDNGNSDVPRVTLTDTTTTNTDLTALTVDGRVKATVPPTAGQVGDDSFMFSAEATAREGLPVGGTEDPPVNEQEDDRIKHTVTHYDAGIARQWNVAASVSQHDPAWDGELVGDPTIVWSSSDDAIQTIDQAGNTHYQSNGEVRFIGTSAAIGTSPARTSYTEWLTSGPDAEPTYDTVTYTDDVGSCRENANDAVDDRIGVGGDKGIFTNYTSPYTGLIRNASCWAQKAGTGLDLTCISPYNSEGIYRQAQTLISPRHIVGAHHSGYWVDVGATVRFTEADNTVVDRVVVGHQQIGTTDIHIALLDSDVSGGIGFAKVLPDGYATYLPANYTNSGQYIASLGLDQEEKALVTDIKDLDINNQTTCQVPTDSTRLDFYEPIEGGDSGNPCFLIVNDELVVVTCWRSGGAGSGPAIHENKVAINAAMNTLGGGYQLTEVDLSGFNSY